MTSDPTQNTSSAWRLSEVAGKVRGASAFSTKHLKWVGVVWHFRFFTDGITTGTRKATQRYDMTRYCVVSVQLKTNRWPASLQHRIIQKIKQNMNWNKLISPAKVMPLLCLQIFGLMWPFASKLLWYSGYSRLYVCACWVIQCIFPSCVCLLSSVKFVGCYLRNHTEEIFWTYFGTVWPWTLTSWPQKLMVSCCCTVDHLCQFASKSVHLL